MKTDLQLQTDVLAELRADPSLSSSDIAVACRNGVVTLAGEVDSLIKQTAAVRAAQRVRGVRALADDICVHLDMDSRRTDVDLAHDAVNALIWDTEVPDKTIKARVQDGWIWLVGEADWDYQRMAAERAVESITGVKGVTNAVRLARTAQPPELAANVSEAIARQCAPADRAIAVDVDQRCVLLRGHVGSWRQRAMAERAAWSARGVTAVDNRLAVIDR